MTLEQLRYFKILAQWEHVGRAAKAAAVSPSALSTAISQLEGDLGRKLFDRIGRNIRLNNHGRELLPKVSAVLAELKSIRDGSESKSDAGFQGVLRLGASPFLATEVLAPAWGRFHAANPFARLELSAPGTGETIGHLLRGEVEAALVFSPQNHPDLRIEPLSEGYLLPAARAGHPIFSERPSRRLGALTRFPLISHVGAPGVELCEEHEDLKKNGITARSSAKFSSDDQAVRLLAGSTAWSLLPDIVIRTYSKSIRAIDVSKGWAARYRVCWIFRGTQIPSAGLVQFTRLTTRHFQGR